MIRSWILGGALALALASPALAACPAGNTGPCEPWSTGNDAATDIVTLTNTAKFGLSTAAGTWRTTTGLEILSYLSAKSWTFATGTVNFTGTTQLNGVAFGTAATKNTGTSGATVPLLNGNLTFSGTLAASGLSAGTIVSGGFIGLDSGNNLVLGAGGSGGSLTVTDGTHSVSSTTSLTFGNGSLVSGSGGSATVNWAATDNTKTASYSVIAGDMANALTLAATSGTPALTLPTASSTIFAPGMTLAISVPKITSGVNWTVTNSTGLTMRGLTSTTLLPGTQGTFVANADATTLDFFPGAQVATTTTLGSVIPDNSTITISNGVITATAGGTGCTVSGGAGAVFNNGSSACITNTDMTFASGTLSLGVNTSEAGKLKLFGSTSGNGTITFPAAAGTNSVLTFPGATFDFSGSGGTSQVVKQTSSGGAFSVARLACADLSDSGTGCPAGAASTSTAGIAKLHNVPVSAGWIATVNPNNVVIAVINQASTISAIIGAVETATGGTATVSVSKAASGTACSGGTVLHSGSFNANGTAATNQTLTVTTSTLSAGDRLCLQTTGTTTWTGGTGIGTITVFLAPS